MILRFFRLYPLHLATTLAFLALVISKQFVLPAITSPQGQRTASRRLRADAVAQFGLAALMGVTSYAILNAPSWSISAEFWTYVVFAVVCVALSRSLARVAAMVIIGAIAMAMILAFNSERGLATYIDYGFFRCLASLALVRSYGCSLSALPLGCRGRRRKSPCWQAFWP